MSYKEKTSQNNAFEVGHLTDDQQSEVAALHHKERRNVSIVLGLVIGFGLQDFIEDLSEGAGWLMVTTDMIYVSIMIGLLLYIWRHVPLARRQQSAFLAQAALEQRRDAEVWRRQAAELLQGLARMIGDQFVAWNLSLAEQQVAFLLLKGYSLKQIAALRGTGERTVRQQAAGIYSKAGLSGRAELSAFFLEDLLPPSDANMPSG